MTMIGKDCPIRANAFCLSSEKRDSSAAMSPAETLCFDIFSPPPGDSDVISQVERLSSNETKIAPRLVRIAVGFSEGGWGGTGRYPRPMGSCNGQSAPSSVSPGAFDQRAPGMGVAGLGDAAAPDGLATR